MKVLNELFRATLAALALLIPPAGPTVAAAQQRSGATTLPSALCDRARALAPVALATPVDELERLAEITGCSPDRIRLIRRAGISPPPSTRFALRALPVSLTAVERTAYPDDRNNGPLWEGVGISSALRLGGELRVPFLTVSLQPELLYQQNRDFDVRLSGRVGFSEFASPYYTEIDLPQRFGTEASWRLAPGDSYARIDVGWAAAGASTESLWRGPALRYPILMSNTAGGFPHVFVGTSRGVDVYVGHLSGELVWGRLTESDYFDDFSDNDETGLVNVTLAFGFRWLPGLSLGGTRSYLYRAPMEGLDPIRETLGFSTTTNRVGNELASLFGRWVFPASGAEVYAEWARDDALGEWPEFLQEPDHSQAYLLGFQKVAAVSEGLSLRVHGELVHLQEKGETRTDSRPMPVYYTHAEVTQGYTHRGQLLGAGTGPGSDAQFLAIDALLAHGSVGAYYERIRRNEQTRDALALRRWAPYEHDTELIGGLRGLLLRGPFSASADLRRTLRYNRDFRDDDRSWRIELRLGWSPDLEVTL